MDNNINKDVCPICFVTHPLFKTSNTVHVHTTVKQLVTNFKTYEYGKCNHTAKIKG